jgi:hypothetical protein
MILEGLLKTSHGPLQVFKRPLKGLLTSPLTVRKRPSKGLGVLVDIAPLGERRPLKGLRRKPFERPFKRLF